MTGARRRRYGLWGVVASVFVSETGVGSILPILPLYLRGRGTSLALVGIVVSAALAAQGVGQWPAGWLSDRWGRRRLMVAGLLASSLASFAFVLPLPVVGLIALRVIQGLGFAAALPAQRAAVADLVPAGELGVAYGWLAGARQSGLIAGPAIGGLLAVFGGWTVFVLTGAALAAGATVALLTLPPMLSGAADGDVVHGRREGTRPGLSERLGGRRPVQAWRGVLLVMIGVGFLIGVYDVIWSLYMRHIGASDWQVGLSFSLFALPLVVMTPVAGWLADRQDRRLLAGLSAAVASAMAPIYPLIRNVGLIIGVGAIEAAVWAFAEPSVNSYLMDAVHTQARGEAQGSVGMAQGLAMAAGSAVGGALFGVGAGVPFWVAGGVCLLLVGAAVPWLMSAGEGRAGAGIREATVRF